MLMAVPAGAAAQTPAAAQPRATAPVSQDQMMDFSADQVSYDSVADVVTATGEVRMKQDGNFVAADKVIWDRRSGQVYAQGNVVLLTPQGDKLLGRHGRKPPRCA
jgi:LPS-assembly protein